MQYLFQDVVYRCRLGGLVLLRASPNFIKNFRYFEIEIMQPPHNFVDLNIVNIDFSFIYQGNTVDTQNVLFVQNLKGYDDCSVKC